MSRYRPLKVTLALAFVAFLMALAPAVGASPPQMPPLDGYLTGCTGEYFNNTSLSGSPAVTRTDGSISFFWPEGTSPAPGITVDNYSVRWTCAINAPSDGNYTFSTTADDGMNILVDGNLILWAWYDQGPSSYSKTVYLTAGGHTVVVQYYNHTLGGTALVTSSLGTGGSPSSTFPDWTGQYFNNTSLSGAPIITRDDPNINFNWGYGSPDPSIPADYFSARWTRTAYFGDGNSQFTTTTDDGVRLWVDSSLVIDQWHDQSPTSYTANVSLAAGYHTIRMEYFDDTGPAIAQLSYSGSGTNPPPSGGVVVGVWVGQYYNNASLSGSPVFYHNDTVLNFNWGYGSPDPSVPPDNFSAKWDSYQNIPVNGVYTIVATSDDGVRVWLDGGLVIDAWYDHSPMTFTATRNMGAGLHAFHVEYYERTGGGLISVQIVPGSSTGPGGPPPYGGEVIVNDLGPGWQAGGKSTSWRSASGIDGHAFWTFNNTYPAPYYNWARWFPPLPGAGYYAVYAFVPPGLGSTLNARYWVYHGGRYDLAPRSQAFAPNQWLGLGTYYFSGGGGEFVSLSDVTYECYLCRTVAFDAVKFSRR